MLVTRDRAIRVEVRQCLHLPKGTALGYFYALISECGLGIYYLSTLIPIYRKEPLYTGRKVRALLLACRASLS
jgi:hypothetical protein